MELVTVPDALEELVDAAFFNGELNDSLTHEVFHGKIRTLIHGVRLRYTRGLDLGQVMVMMSDDSGEDSSEPLHPVRPPTGPGDYNGGGTPIGMRIAA